MKTLFVIWISIQLIIIGIIFGDGYEKCIKGNPGVQQSTDKTHMSPEEFTKYSMMFPLVWFIPAENLKCSHVIGNN